MKGKKFSGDIDRLIGSAADATGQSRDELTQKMTANPQLAGLLSRLSPSDMEKLQQVLSDPTQARQILATPQAQAMLRTLQSRQANGAGQTGGGKDGQH